MISTLMHLDNNSYRLLALLTLCQQFTDINLPVAEDSDWLVRTSLFTNPQSTDPIRFNGDATASVLPLTEDRDWLVRTSHYFLYTVNLEFTS